MKMNLYPWTAENFPRLNDMQHDLLCAAQDAGGLVTLEDLCDSCDFSSRQREKAGASLERLMAEKLIRKHVSGRLDFFELTSTGAQYLDCPPPVGVEV